MHDRPIRLVVRDDDLARSRLTVFFRLLLAIPHLVWVALWGIAAFVVAFVLWLAVLIDGKPPTGLHDFAAGYIRYATQVSAYLFLAAGPYPGFRGAPGYAVDVEIDPPERQNRWTALVRIVLALPALVLAAVLGAGLSTGSPGQTSWQASGSDAASAGWIAGSAAGVAAIAASLAWFAILATGREPRGLRDLKAYALGYGAQAGGYVLLLTDRYPSSDPALAEPFAQLPPHPVAIAIEDDLQRSRLTVLFRLLLAIPHLVWVALWSIAAVLAAVVAWVAVLATGRVPSTLHRFLAAYVRYSAHVGAFLYLVGRRFPGFVGRAGSYEVDVEIAGRKRQSRWRTGFRLLLAIPALVLAGALGGVLVVVAVLGWFVALVTGRMPEGLRNLGAACLRYSAQATAFLLLVTDRYPYAAPVLRPGLGDTDVPGATPAGEPL